MNKNLQTLISHQAWRTGSEDGMIDPADISKALNWAIGELTHRTTTDNTAVIRQLEREVDQERKSRREAQILLASAQEERALYGRMISTALQGKRHPKEPDNDGRLDAVRAMSADSERVKDKYRTEQSLRAQVERHCDKLSAENAELVRLHGEAVREREEAIEALECAQYQLLVEPNQ